MRIFLLMITILSVSLNAAAENLFPYEKSETEIQRWEIYSGKNPTVKIRDISRIDQRISNDTANSEILIYRSGIFLPEPLQPHDGLTISVPALLSSYEVFWDNSAIGSNGTVSSRSPGKSGRYFYIPPERCGTGAHVISIHASGLNGRQPLLTHPITIGISEILRQKHLERLALSLFLAGIFTITAIFHLFIINNRKRRYSHIIFSIFALSCGGHLAVNMLIFFGAVRLDHFYRLAIAGDIFWFGMTALLPIFFLSHFSAYKRKETALVILILSAAVTALPRLALYDILPIRLLPILHDLTLFYAYAAAAAAILVTFGAVLRKRKGSRTIFLGMCVFFTGLIITTLFNIENGWSIGFAFLNAFITIAISRQFSDERKQYYKAELRASRLELELLKSHMQPHFLLNSLNSIVAWIEEEPAVAAKLVNALSQELRLLMAYAGERTINLSQEIKMCRIHLEVMNMRQEKNYTLIVKGEREGIEIPPFILHTLIENGISHGFRKKDEGVFTLTVNRTKEAVTMQLHNNGDNRARTAAGEGKGTGIRYIRGRLQELYGTGYRFKSGSVPDGWESTITIPGEISA